MKLKNWAGFSLRQAFSHRVIRAF